MTLWEPRFWEVAVAEMESRDWEVDLVGGALTSTFESVVVPMVALAVLGSERALRRALGVEEEGSRKEGNATPRTPPVWKP